MRRNLLVLEDAGVVLAPTGYEWRRPLEIDAGRVQELAMAMWRYVASLDGSD